MRSILLLVIFNCLLLMPACKHTKKLNARYTGKTHSKSPFRQPGNNSRYVNFTVSIIDKRYGNSMFVISIYDNNPETGGRLLSKGSATVSLPFSTRILLFEQVRTVYIIKTAYDSSFITTKVTADDSDITRSM